MAEQRKVLKLTGEMFDPSNPKHGLSLGTKVNVIQGIGIEHTGKVVGLTSKQITIQWDDDEDDTVFILDEIDEGFSTWHFKEEPEAGVVITVLETE